MKMLKANRSNRLPIATLAANSLERAVAVTARLDLFVRKAAYFLIFMSTPLLATATSTPREVEVILTRTPF